MIHITFAAEQEQLAQQIRDDLAGLFDVSSPLLIVLVSAASNRDPVVAAEIARARQSGAQLLPILTENVALPEMLEYEKALNFAAGYRRDSLRRRVSQLTMSSREVRQANRRALLAIGAIAALMFGLAIMGMLSGLVAFPVAEYNEEATFQALWIDGMIGATLAYAQPRSTADALNYAATLEAAPTRLHRYMRGTATALPRLQEE